MAERLKLLRRKGKHRKPTLRRAGGALLAAGLILGVATGAGAVEPASSQDQIVSGINGAAIVGVMDERDEAAIGSIEETMLLTRWGGATANIHSRLDGLNLADMPSVMQRSTIQNGAISVGNFMWSTSLMATKLAGASDVVSTVGGAVDSALKTVLRSLIRPTESGGHQVSFLGWLVIAALIAGIATTFRGVSSGTRLKMIGSKVIIAALLVGSATQLINSNPRADSTYRPAALTPGWVVTSVSDAISTLADIPARAINATGITGIQLSTGGQYSCKNYLQGQKQAFQERANSAIRSSDSEASMRTISGTMQSIDSLWQTTGLRTYIAIQTGDTKYGDYMFCRLHP